MTVRIAQTVGFDKQKFLNSWYFNNVPELLSVSLDLMKPLFKSNKCLLYFQMVESNPSN